MGTGEYLGETQARIDPEETKLQKKNVYLRPAYSTFLRPPKDAAKKIQVFKNGKWSMKSDYRGTKYYNMDGEEFEITKIGKRVPAGHTTKAPPSNLIEPVWGGTDWIETAPIFLGKMADTREKVKRIVKESIENLGEEKAKTLYLMSLADDDYCPEWDNFIIERGNLLLEADQFIKDNILV
jgi:hypothetical protein